MENIELHGFQKDGRTCLSTTCRVKVLWPQPSFVPNSLSVLSVSPLGRTVLVKSRGGYATIDVETTAVEKVRDLTSDGVFYVGLIEITDEGLILAQCSVDQNHRHRSTRVGLFDPKRDDFVVLPPAFLLPEEAADLSPLAANDEPVVARLQEMLQRGNDQPSTHTPSGITLDGRIYGWGCCWSGRARYYCYWDKNEAGRWQFWKLPYDTHKCVMGFGCDSLKLVIGSSDIRTQFLRIQSVRERRSIDEWLCGKHPSIVGVAVDGSFFGDITQAARFRQNGKPRVRPGPGKKLSYICRPSWNYRPLVLDMPRRELLVKAMSPSGKFIAGQYGPQIFLAQEVDCGYECMVLQLGSWWVQEVIHVTDDGFIFVQGAKRRPTVEYPGRAYPLCLIPKSL